MFAQFLDKWGEKSTYLALGDSLISDCYPGPGLGAASLLYRNCNEHFPEWRGRDLLHLYPGIARVGITRSGYCLDDVAAQIGGLRGVAEVGLLSVGGNDLLREAPQTLNSSAFFERFSSAYGRLLQQLRPRARRWLICTVYDPSDGTGILPGPASRGLPPRPQLVTALQRVNEIIRRHAGDQLVDVHDWCQGHGWGSAEPWYQFDIEPNRRGASKLRELFWRALQP